MGSPGSLQFSRFVTGLKKRNLRRCWCYATNPQANYCACIRRRLVLSPPAQHVEKPSIKQFIPAQNSVVGDNTQRRRLLV